MSASWGWHERMKNILMRKVGYMALNEVTEGAIITGSCSPLGQELITRLSSRYRVFALDLSAAKESPGKSVRFQPIDFGSEVSIGKAVRRITQSGLPMAAWIHLSGHPATGVERLPVELVDGSEHFLKCLQDEAVSLGSIIYLSTADIYEPFAPGVRVNEDWPERAREGFAEVANEVEERLLAQRDDTKLMSLRAGEIYGNGFVGEGLRSILLHAMGEKAEIEDPQREPLFLHHNDLVEAFYGAIIHHDRLPAMARILLGEAESPRLDFLKNEARWCWQSLQEGQSRDSKPMLQTAHLPEEPEDHFELDVTRAREWLGWEPRHRIVEELPRLVEKVRTGGIAPVRAETPHFYSGYHNFKRSSQKGSHKGKGGAFGET